MSAIYLNELGVLCALGSGHATVRAALLAEQPSGVHSCTELQPGRELQLGRVQSALVGIDELPKIHRSRNNALLLTALAQIRSVVDTAIATVGQDRVGIVLGTSTSGIAQSELAIAHHQLHGHLPDEFHVAQQELGSPAAMLAEVLRVNGPAYVISTACSSSAKALASAARLLRAGICDVVLAGGVDSLCRFTVAGFTALESVSAQRCNPFSVNRNGINIGEGAALFMLSRQEGPVSLAGWGETSDAHHISAPEPSGSGAFAAMELALQRAGLPPSMIDYVNLHGTATLQNDAMEARAVHGLFGADTPMSSTKPLTGHTLGAAGAIEAALCWLCMVDNPEGRLPAHWWDGVPDPALAPLSLIQPGRALDRPLAHALSNSFAFGGNNASLLFSRTQQRAGE